MKSKARIAGHPIHPMLIAFPVALYTATVVALFVHLATGDAFWFRAAMWSNIAGVVMAVVAAIPGFVDLLSIPSDTRAKSVGLRHAGFNVLALILFLASAIVLYRNYSAGSFDATAPLVLSILGLLSTVAAGWLGWNLVQTHHIGVIPGRDDVAIQHGATGEEEVPMPATYTETFQTT